MHPNLLVRPRGIIIGLGLHSLVRHPKEQTRPKSGSDSSICRLPKIHRTREVRTGDRAAGGVYGCHVPQQGQQGTPHGIHPS